MSEYNQYVTAINKIFDYLAKMKAGWNSQDNLSYIENIEEYKSIVANNVSLFKEKKTPEKPKPEKLEVLDND